MMETPPFSRDDAYNFAQTAGLNQELVWENIESRRLNSFKLPEIKTLIKFINARKQVRIKLQGNKPELTQRLQAYLEGRSCEPGPVQETPNRHWNSQSLPHHQIAAPGHIGAGYGYGAMNGISYPAMNPINHQAASTYTHHHLGNVGVPPRPPPPARPTPAVPRAPETVILVDDEDNGDGASGGGSGGGGGGGGSRGGAFWPPPLPGRPVALAPPPAVAPPRPPLSGAPGQGSTGAALAARSSPSSGASRKRPLPTNKVKREKENPYAGLSKEKIQLVQFLQSYNFYSEQDCIYAVRNSDDLETAQEFLTKLRVDRENARMEDMGRLASEQDHEQKIREEREEVVNMRIMGNILNNEKFSKSVLLGSGGGGGGGGGGGSAAFRAAVAALSPDFECGDANVERRSLLVRLLVEEASALRWYGAPAAAYFRAAAARLQGAANQCGVDGGVPIAALQRELKDLETCLYQIPEKAWGAPPEFLRCEAAEEEEAARAAAPAAAAAAGPAKGGAGAGAGEGQGDCLVLVGTARSAAAAAAAAAAVAAAKGGKGGKGAQLPPSGGRGGCTGGRGDAQPEVIVIS